jgi:hypothetical protein
LLSFENEPRSQIVWNILLYGGNHFGSVLPTYIYFERRQGVCPKYRSESEIGEVYGQEVKGICAGCRVIQDEWQGNRGQGYLKNGQSYCCRDCAEGIACTCGL